MNVRELIDQLEGLPQDAEVHFSYDYGDYWHTQVAPEVTNVDQSFVKHSDYHNMDRIVDEPEEDDDNTRLVVVLG
jgi:hypothetical protein